MRKPLDDCISTWHDSLMVLVQLVNPDWIYHAVSDVIGISGITGSIEAFA